MVRVFCKGSLFKLRSEQYLFCIDYEIMNFSPNISKTSSYHPSLGGYPPTASSYVSQVSTGSLQLVATRDLYKTLICFLDDTYSLFQKSEASAEVTALKTVLSDLALSPALINHKAGQFIAAFLDDLLDQIRKALETRANEIQQKWANLGCIIAWSDFCDENLEELTIPGPVIILSIIKSLTGTLKEPVYGKIFQETLLQKKPKKLRVKKFMQKARTRLMARPKQSNEANLVNSLLFYNVKHLKEEEVTNFVGFLMEHASVIFGGEFGPRIGLRYAAAVYHVAIYASQAENQQPEGARTLRMQRLEEWVECLYQTCHDYHNQAMEYLSKDCQTSVEATANPSVLLHNSNILQKLKYDVVELTGKLVADVLSSTPEHVLLRAADFVKAPYAGHQSNHNINESNCSMEEVQQKVSEFALYLDSLKISDLRSCSSITDSKDELANAQGTG